MPASIVNTSAQLEQAIFDSDQVDECKWLVPLVDPDSINHLVVFINEPLPEGEPMKFRLESDNVRTRR